MQNGHGMRRFNFSSHGSDEARILRPREMHAYFLTFACDVPTIQGEQCFIALGIGFGEARLVSQMEQYLQLGKLL